MKNYEEVASDVFRRRDEYETVQKQRKQAVRRRLTATLTAFAIVFAVSVVGVAAAALSGAEWFTNFFTKDSGSTLSEKQQQYIENGTVDVRQSMTIDDITITLKSFISNRNLFHVYLDVVAPEGVSLDEVNLGYIWGQGNGQYSEPFSVEAANGKAIYVEATSEKLDDDGDGLSNTRTYYFVMEVYYEGTREEYILAEEGALTVCVNGLQQGASDVCVSKGQWKFDLTFEPVVGEGIEILSESVVCGAYDVFTKEAGKVEIQSFCLYEMLAHGHYVPVNGTYDDPTIMGSVEVVMKDGTIIRDDSRAFCDGDFRIVFKAPIILEEVDYILLGGYEDADGNWVDGVRVEIPQQ